MKANLVIEQHIQTTILSQISNYRNLLVAYSGGVDSTVLLHALVMLKKQHLPELKLAAIYINHGISENADSWDNHCQQQCKLWGLPYFTERVILDTKKGNIEKQARDVRYHAISAYMKKETVLCVAQHLDDQCETFFLALKRGSGPKGLSGIPNITKLDEKPLLRPLLGISRQQIEEYAKLYNLNWIEDESNQNEDYDRNFLRRRILPVIHERWPHFNKMVARSSELCQDQERLLDELLTPCFNQLIDDQLNVIIPPLLNYSLVKRNALLRMWFKHHNMNMPSRDQLDNIWNMIVLAKKDANPQLMIQNKQIRRYQNKLYLLPQYQDLQSIIFDWDLKETFILPDEVGKLSIIYDEKNSCRLPKLDEKVSIRFYATGSYQITERQHSRHIKKLWQEFGISPWMRSRIPLIFYNEILITAVGLFITLQGKGDEVNYQLNSE